MATGPAGLAAAGGDRRRGRRAVVRRAGGPPRRRRSRRRAPGPPLRHRAAAGRAVRRLRPAPPRAARRTGRAGAGVAGDLGWQPRAVAAAAPAGGRRRPGAAAARRVRRAARRAGAGRAARRGCRCSGRPGCRPRTWPCWSRWPSTATCTCGCRTPPPRCGTGWPRWPHRSPEPSRVPPRRADPTAAAARHPLLSSLGRDVRELQVRLAAAAPHARHRHHPLPDPPPTLLGRLQRRLRDDEPPSAPEPLAAGDRSVQVHACHGPHRQVEVLREVIVGLLADDETLQPRDVLVMCPDVETFAPLVSAAFGLHEPGADRHPGQRLPVRLADRALRQVNPLLDTVATLLELADDPGHRRAGAGPAGLAAGAAAVPARRRRPGPAAGPGRAGRGALGAGRRAPRPLPAAGLPAEHLGRRAGPAAARGDHVRGRRRRRAVLAGHRAAAGRRRVRGHHAGRAARPSSSTGWPGCSTSCPASGR